ncbi:MAG: Na+/H+ antiporter subunit E [Pseudomonadota bacterium]
MKHAIGLTFGLAVLWLSLSGYFDKQLLLALGVLSVGLSLWFAHRIGAIDSAGAPIHLFPGILGYWLWLFLEIGKANVIVARAALSTDMTLSPKMVRVPAPQKTAVGRVTFANSITLTPGTVSVDVSGADILVHALTEELADVDGMADMGRRVCAFEGKDTAAGGEEA